MTTVVYEALGYDFATQGRLLFYSFILGAALGCVFDIFRITRVFLRSPYGGRAARFFSNAVMTAVSFVEDIAFFLLSAVSITVFSYHFNSGRTRGFILIFVLAGFYLYLVTVGRLTGIVSNALSRLLWSFLRILILKITVPFFKVIYGTVLRIYGVTLGRIVSSLVLSINKLTTERVRRELVRTASFGELQMKGISNESSADVNTGEACHIPRVLIYDSYPRQRADKTQRAGRGERATH